MLVLFHIKNQYGSEKLECLAHIKKYSSINSLRLVVSHFIQFYSIIKLKLINFKKLSGVSHSRPVDPHGEAGGLLLHLAPVKREYKNVERISTQKVQRNSFWWRVSYGFQLVAFQTVSNDILFSWFHRCLTKYCYLWFRGVSFEILSFSFRRAVLKLKLN